MRAINVTLTALAIVTFFTGTAIGAQTPEPTHAIAMHGAPKYGPDFKHFDYVNPKAPKGGLVKLGTTGSFDSLNPFIVRGEAAIALGRLYDTLTAAAADEPFTQYGLLAESMRVPKDRSWVSFTLRPQARWHDGKPVTVEDVIFSFNILREKGSPFYRLYYASVDTVEKTGARTVKFTFKPGENRELPLILGQLAILPKHYWETRDFTKTTLEPPLGSGAYRIDKVDAGRSISYRRVADYWGRDLPVNVGQGNFDVIRYDYYRDRTVELEAFKAGEFHFRQENSSKNWATAYDIPAVREKVLRKEAIEHNRSSGIQGFVFNTRREIFADSRVRQALAFAFDFEWSNKNLFYGQYKRTRSYFDNSELAATGLPSPEELKILEPYRGRIPDEVFTKEYNPPKTDGTGRIRSNLRQADSLLKEAGWVIKGRKRVNTKTGQELSFQIVLVSPLFERIALPFAKNLKRLGVNARVRTVDSAQYLRLLETFDFDMVSFIWGQSLSPGNEQRNFWGSGAAKQNGSRNFMGVNDPVVDELIEKVIAAPDREALILRCRALDRVLQWGHYLIPHFHLGSDRLVFWDKFGVPKVTPLRGAQFETWWIDPEKASTLAERKKQVGKK
jgi:microcin C transport system substrate-binding protein